MAYCSDSEKWRILHKDVNLPHVDALAQGLSTWISSEAELCVLYPPAFDHVLKVKNQDGLGSKSLDIDGLWEMIPKLGSWGTFRLVLLLPLSNSLVLHLS